MPWLRLVAILLDPKDILKLLLIVLAVPALLILLVAGPITVHEKVPMSPPSKVKIYVEAAKAASESTKTACDQGLEVDWKPLIAIEAVRLKQDFSQATKARAENLARRFVEQAGKTKCQAGVNAEGKAVYTTVPTFRLRSVEEVMADLGMTREGQAKAREYLAFDMNLLKDVGTDCVPVGWTPREGEWRWPLPGHFAITSCFGPRVDPVEGIDGMHHGLDVGAETGNPIVAARAGKVVIAGPYGVYGNAVMLRHDDGAVTLYAHMDRVAVERSGGWFRRKEVRVEAGQVIGYAGSTGKSTGPHLHFEVRRGGQAVDPVTFYR